MREQTLMATWAFKTSMMLELGRLGDEQDFTPSTHHRHVFERQEPPETSWVWAAAYSGRNSISVQQSRLRLSSSGCEAAAFITTMTIGALVLQTFWYWDHPDRIEIENGPRLPRLLPDPPETIDLPPKAPHCPTSRSSSSRLAS